jgi:putative lipoprotein
MALPVGATFEATLEDVSRADAPADVIGKARIESASNPPYKFSITYDPSKIDQTHRYNVRARITFKDEVLFTSDQAYPVITGGHPNHVSIVMKMVVAHGASKPLSNPDSAGKPPGADRGEASRTRRCQASSGARRSKAAAVRRHALDTDATW